MESNEKVWVIVYRLLDGSLELLALKPSPEPGRNTEYYVVTGGIEKDETLEMAARREVREEIGILPLKIIDLKTSLKYKDKFSGQEFIEHCYAGEIDNKKIILNEEHIDYKWLSPAEFTKNIWWDGDREKLKDVVIKLGKKLRN